MNDDTPYTTIGDEPVEARIVSWVLGEASAFEAAELERLCEERPELLVFRNRMRALHGLLGEAEAAEGDDSWKLPPEKRKLIDKILEGQKVIGLEEEKEKRIRYSGRRALLTIAACLVLTVVVAGLMAPMVIRQRKKADSSAQDTRMMEEGLGQFPLTTKFPPELIEGTPKPMKVPNLIHPPTDGPVLSKSAQQMAERNMGLKSLTRDSSLKAGNSRTAGGADGMGTASDEGKPESKALALKGDGDLGESSEVVQTGIEERQVKPRELRGGSRGTALKASAPAMRTPEPSAPVAVAETSARDRTEEIRDGKLSLKRLSKLADRTSRPSRPQEPDAQSGSSFSRQDARSRRASEISPVPSEKPASGPVSSISKVIAANSSAPVSIPVPDLPGNAPSMDFGDGDDFGDGWGDARGGGGVGGGGVGGRGRGSATRSKSKQSVPDDAIVGLQLKKAETAPTKEIDAFDNARVSELDSLRVTDMEAERKDTNGRGGKWKDEGERVTDDSGSVRASVGFDANGMVAGGRDLDKVAADKKSNLSSLSDKLEELSFKDLKKEGLFTNGKAKQQKLAERGFRSGDVAIRRTSIDAILNGPARSNAALTYEYDGDDDEVRRKLNTAEESHNLGKSDKLMSESEAGQLPLLGDIPVTGRLLHKEENEESGEGLKLLFSDGLNEDMPADPAESSFGVNHGGRIDHSAPVAGGGPLGATEHYYSRVGGEKESSTSREFIFPTEYDPPEVDYYSGLSPESLGAVVSGGVLNMEEFFEKRAAIEGLEVGDELATGTTSSFDGSAARWFFENGLHVSDGSEIAKNDMTWTRDEVPGQSPSEYLLRGRDLGESKKAKPAPVTPLDLMEEVAAAEDPYSTFSLNISDASFQIAMAALAKGEQPDPAGIKVEQFYNGVDYGDPAPAAGEPVAVTIEQSAHPVIPGRNLVRIALKTAAAGRSAAQPLRLTLLIDQSGSMVREDRRVAMDKALAGLAGLLSKDDLVTVIGFSRTSRLLADGWTGDRGGKLVDLVNQAASQGGTNLEDAIQLAGQMAGRRKLEGAQNRIVLFTDGAANLGDADPERLSEKVKELRQQGIAFDIAGIAADGLNDELLGDLARHGNGRYYVVGKGGDDHFANQLAGAFRPAAENVKVQVHFNPERVRHYKLIGFEKDRLQTEDFRDDSVDAAEMAAEEAGIAIYQVEPIAGGKGELGDVSVRFRDTASGEMVERSWTLPHDSRAPALDRATPSMQLSVLSMLAAEKLRGGPLGEAIDFKQFTAPRAGVKQFYSNSGRVAEMLRMIDSL